MNKRFEARLDSLPQQPRELISSTTAPSSRERNASRLSPFQATESLRTGNEGLFSRVRSELAQTKYVIPDTYLPTDPETPITLVIASSNQHKIDSILTHITNHRLSAIRVEEAAHAELHTGMVEIDAASKALRAIEIIQTSEDTARRDIRTKPHVAIANDQMNAVPVIVEDNKTGLSFIEFHRLGKPKTDSPDNATESVRDTFTYLAEVAEKHGWTTIPYIIELATIIRNPSDSTNAISTQKTAVFLSIEGVKQLATDRFDEYVEKVAQQAGKTNGKTGVTDIAGGLEFAVLDSMGLVEFVSGSIDEIQTGGFPPTQRPEAKEHAYNLALSTADARLIQEYFGGKAN